MAEDLEDIKKALALNTPTLSGIPKEPGPVQRYVLSPLGKVLDVLDTDLNLTTQALRPIATSINPNLEQVYKEKGFGTVPSDLIDKSLENSPMRKLLAPVLGFAANVALSPTTYLAGVGTLTKAGKMFSKISSLSEAGQAIKLDSNIAKEIGLHYGETNITPQLINRAVKEAKTFSVASLAQQAKMGQRALINIGIPFTKTEIPALRSELFFRGVEKSADLVKGNRFGEAFTKIFSTSSGNAKFDRLRHSIVGALRFEVDDVKTQGARLGKIVDQVSKEYGIARDDAFKMVTDIAENPYRGDISADALLQTFGDKINKQIVDSRKIDDIVNSIPGVHSITMDERQRLFDNLLRIAKEKQAGFDVYTVGFKQMPLEARTVFIKEWTNSIGIKFAKDIKRDGKIEFADFPTVVKAYNQGINFKGVKIDPGDDAGLFAMLGKSEYIALKERAAKIAATNKTLRVPASLPGSTEEEILKDTLHRVLAHVDGGFTTAYTLFRTAPEHLKSIAPRLFKVMELIDSKDNWKVTSLVDQFKIPLEYAKKYPKILNIAQDVRGYMQHLLQLEQNAGVQVGEFVGNVYVPHVPVKEIRELLSKKYSSEFGTSVRQWDKDHVSTLARKLRNIDSRKVEEFYNTGEITKRQRQVLLGKRGVDYAERLAKNRKWSDAKVSQLYHYLTVSEVNAMARRGDLELLGKGVKVDRFFEENPASQVLIRGVRGAKARTSMDFYDAAKNFGKWHNINDPLPEGFSFVKNPNANPLAETKYVTSIVNGKKVRTAQRMIFEDNIVRHIDQLHEALILPPDLHPLLKVYDGVQSEWKAWTLSIFPAYHIRNVVGNLWNNYLAGIHTPDPYLKALDIQRGKNVLITLGNGQKLNAKQIFTLAEKHGIINSGQFWGDIREYFEAELKSGVKKYYGKYARPPVNFGLKVGNYLENNAKLALFIRRLEEGHSAPSAMMEVKKYLFDYSNLSSSEREVLRRVFPFYSWTRFNVPLQLEALLTHPSRLMTVAKAKSAIETNYDGVPEERLLPDYYTQNFPIRVRYDQGSKQFQYLMLNNWLPAADIDKIFDPVGWVKAQLTPLLKEPAQQMANRDFFTNREIDSGDEYQTLKVLGLNLNLPARQVHALKNIRFISELDRLSNPETPTSEKLGRLTTGKLYGFDVDKERKFEKTKYRDEKSHIRAMIHKARLKGNEGEEKRLTKRLEQIREEHGNKIGG